MSLPPRWVRHYVIAPLFTVLGTWLIVLASPLVLLFLVLAAFVLPSRLRVPRLIGFAVIYFVVEILGLWVLFWYWLTSGFGRLMQTPRLQIAHYRLLRGLLAVLMVSGRRLFRVEVLTDGPILVGDDNNPFTEEFPLLVLSRHAGPGDSFLLIHELLTWGGRRPRIVLKDTLQLDPFIDICLNRLPMRFVNPTNPNAGTIEAIADLSRTMSDPDALVIFPEGGNVTPARRARAIEKLKESGLAEAAERAERIKHLMPPRPGGVAAALEANPELQVVVVAHTGLDDLDSVRDIWRQLPQDKIVRMGWQVFPNSSVGRGNEAVSDWLFDRWEEMDSWVADSLDAQQE